MQKPPLRIDRLVSVHGSDHSGEDGCAAGVKTGVVANLVSVVLHIRYYEAAACFLQTVMQAAGQEFLRTPVGLNFPFNYAEFVTDGSDLADQRREIPPPEFLFQELSGVPIQFIHVSDHAQFVPLHIPKAYILVTHRERE